MNILISSAGRRVTLLNAFRHELTKFFLDGQVFAADMRPNLSPACLSADKSFVVSSVNSPSYVSELLELCQANRIKLIIPTIDTELPVLSINRQLFSDNGIVIAVSEPAVIDVGSDKRLTHDFFVSRGIAVAKEYAKDDLSYPVFVKPVSGSSSKDIYLIKDKSYLFPRILESQELMCLEYLSPSGHDEFTVDCYYSDHGILKCAVPRQRLETRGGEVSKGCTVKNTMEQFVFDKLGQIDGARGCLTWQFFAQKVGQGVVGIELNPRFGGGYPLSYRSGANFPLWLIKEYLLGVDIPVFRDWQANLLMLRYDEDLFLADHKSI